MNADLIARLEAASQGYDEWRVQDPETGSYCIAFDRIDSLDPERDARSWLSTHKANYPTSQFADYVVAKVRVYMQQDDLMREAIEALKAHQKTDEAIEAAAHLTAWRYRKSSDPAHSDTYTFNLACLLDLARGLGVKA